MNKQFSYSSPLSVSERNSNIGDYYFRKTISNFPYRKPLPPKKHKIKYYEKKRVKSLIINNKNNKRKRSQSVIVKPNFDLDKIFNYVYPIKLRIRPISITHKN